jgi:hypothetical protein
MKYLYRLIHSFRIWWVTLSSSEREEMKKYWLHAAWFAATTAGYRWQGLTQATKTDLSFDQDLHRFGQYLLSCEYHEGGGKSSMEIICFVRPRQQ